MAAQYGTFATVMSSANTYVAAGTISPSSNVIYATISINLVNTSDASAAKVRVAVAPSTVDLAYMNTGANAGDIKKYHLEYGAQLTAGGGVLERTCIPVSPGEKVFVWAETGDVAIRVFGLEQASA